MRLKKILSLLLACVMFALMMTGCAGQTGANDGRISISMYMWDRSMFKELSPWLEEKFPNIDFTFVQSYNTMELLQGFACARRGNARYHHLPPFLAE